MKFNHDNFDENIEFDQDQAEEEVVEVSADAQANEWKDRFLRVSAEFENFKKRTSVEQMQWIQRSQQKLIVDILSIVEQQENVEVYIYIHIYSIDDRNFVNCLL